MIEKEIRFIDLFGGVGGFRLGLERANNQTWREIQREGKWSDSECRRDKSNSSLWKERSDADNYPSFKCVWYCDNDRYAVQTYNKNFKENYKSTDIRGIDSKSIPTFELLCAGFPCQSFSIAGKRKGFEDTRGTLFFEICRIVEHHKPKLLFLENVKGLLNHDNGRTFRTILQSIDKLGYDVEWEVLNSKHFGVPQNRERVFIVGNLRGESQPKVFPLREGYEMDNTEQGQGEVAHTIDANYYKGMNTGSKGGRIHTNRGIMVEQDSGKEIARVYNPEGVSPTLKGKSGGWQEPKIITHWPRSGNPKQGGTGILSSEEFYFGLDSTPHFVYLTHKEEGRWGKRIVKEMGTLGTSNDIGVIMNTLTEATGNRAGSSKEFLRTVKNINESVGQIRRLTPIECERLQGFPDNWTSGVSDTQRYRQMGNAVTVNVIEAIGRKILESWI